MFATVLLLQVTAVVGLGVAILRWGRKSGGKALPPGPKPLPVVGNVMDLPPKGQPEWKHWLSHREKYGPITSITVMGQTIVVLHDRKMANELLDKKGIKNSSRPWLEFGWRMCGFGDFTIGLPYGETLRLHRKLLLQYIGTKQAVKSRNNLIEREVGRTLVRMLETPEDLFKHIENQSGSLIIGLTYGYSIDTTRDDPVLFLVRRMMETLGAAVLPGGWLVDAFPILRHVPSWLPGAGFKKVAYQWNQEVLEAVNLPFEFVRRQIKDGTNQASFVSNALSKIGEDKLTPELERNIKYAAVTLYGGGSDTTVATLGFLFLALIKFPQVLAKAQQEIDTVIGSERLPTFADQDNLPYIECLLKEAYRWEPVAPQGLAHSSEEDQEFRGYFIPKGAVLMANTRYYTRDPSIHHNPEEFLPERYLAPHNELSPREYCFGFGRRICPGRVFADQSLWLTIAQTVAVFNIGKAMDSQGREIEPELEIPSGLVAHPSEYPFSLTPRSEKHAELIRSNLQPGVKEGKDHVLLEKYNLLPQNQIA